MNRIDYHNKTFKSTQNSENGEVSGETIFHYFQLDHVVYATYQGGEVHFGTLTGIIEQDGSLRFAYQHVNQAGEIRTGLCYSTPEILADGRIRLFEKWQWTSGDLSRGVSIVEEISA